MKFALIRLTERYVTPDISTAVSNDVECDYLFVLIFLCLILKLEKHRDFVILADKMPNILNQTRSYTYFC